MDRWKDTKQNAMNRWQKNPPSFHMANYQKPDLSISNTDFFTYQGWRWTNIGWFGLISTRCRSCLWSPGSKTSKTFPRTIRCNGGRKTQMAILGKWQCFLKPSTKKWENLFISICKTKMDPKVPTFLYAIFYHSEWCQLGIRGVNLTHPCPPHNSCVHVRSAFSAVSETWAFMPFAAGRPLRATTERGGCFQVPRLEEIKVDLSPSMYLHFCLYLFRQYQVIILWSILGQTKFCGDLLCLKKHRTWSWFPFASRSCMVQPSLFLKRGAGGIWTISMTHLYWSIPSDSLNKTDQTTTSFMKHKQRNSSLFKHLFPKNKLFPAALLPKTTTEPQYGSKWRFARFVFFKRDDFQVPALIFPGSTLKKNNSILKNFRDLVANPNLQPFYSFLPATNSNKQPTIEMFQGWM